MKFPFLLRKTFGKFLKRSSTLLIILVDFKQALRANTP